MYRQDNRQSTSRKEGITLTNQGPEITPPARPESEVAGRPVSRTHTLSRGYPSDSRPGLSNRDDITFRFPVKADSIIFEENRKQIRPQVEPGVGIKEREGAPDGSTSGFHTHGAQSG